MRTLAESQSAWGGSERQAKEVASMLNEIKEWKAKYAKCKSQLRNLKASSICTTTATSSSVITIPSTTTSRAFVSPTGLIADASVARFQVAIDEFVLQTRKRSGSEKALLEKLHGVIAATRTITQEVGSADLNGEQLYESDNGVVKSTKSCRVNSHRPHHWYQLLQTSSLSQAAIIAQRRALHRYCLSMLQVQTCQAPLLS